VVTVSRILQVAAHLDGLYAAGLDQTGLAQKGGPVVSDVRISAHPIDGAVKAGSRSVDLLLGLDLLGAAGTENLAACDPCARWGWSTRRGGHHGHGARPFHRLPPRPRPRPARHSGADSFFLDAQWIAERLFGDHMPTNVLMLGAAYQHGCLPVTAVPGRGHHPHGSDIEQNLLAFAWGRAAVLDADAVHSALTPAAPPPPLLPHRSAA